MIVQQTGAKYDRKSSRRGSGRRNSQCLSPLDVLEHRLSLELYRLLAAGQPIARADLAKRPHISVEIVDRILNAWPGVFSDSERRIVGYWGLALAASYTSPSSIDAR